ncbi:MAG: alpha/beta fold hydrolase [Candidatus Aureabacteria bacterium]|nr:alpha/beta fold hydrolase [Candidatus Auribacterota bacterium]
MKQQVTPAYRVIPCDIAIGAHRIFVEGVRPEMETGKPPILFVGGAFDGSWICRQQLDYWAACGWPAYALNLRGYYKSRWPHVAALCCQDYLNDILSVRNRLAPDGAICAGYSMGGLLMQKFAELHGARALILYDSDAPLQVARMARLRRHTPPPLPSVMHFVPGREIVEEMLGRTPTERELRELLNLFRNSYLSGRAYRELEIERIEVDASQVRCPVITISVSGNDRVQDALAQYYRAARLVCDGYSHGSILMSLHHLPVTRRVTEWLAADFPRRCWRIRKPAQRISAKDREGMTTLSYYTAWSQPTAHVCDRRGMELARVMLRRVGPGRVHGEGICEGRIPLPPGGLLYLSGSTGEDRPRERGFYDPTGRTLSMMDGEFFSQPPPHFRHPPAYPTYELHCKTLAHYYRINVMLPRDYGAGAHGPYPVLVLNDGQNQWKNQGAHGGWHTDAIALDLARRGRCRDVVLVSVVAHPRRDFTYLPPPHGAADQYVDFLADRLLPFLRKELRLSHDPRDIGIVGASYGANCAIYAVIRRPDTFRLAGSFSYALMPSDPIRARMRAARRLPMHRFYADCGTRWAYDQPQRDDHTEITRDLIAIALDKGMRPGENFLGIVAPGHYHNEVFWRKRIGRCLELLYPLP